MIEELQAQNEMLKTLEAELQRMLDELDIKIKELQDAETPVR